MRLLIVIALFSSLAACGMKGPLTPPSGPKQPPVLGQDVNMPASRLS